MPGDKKEKRKRTSAVLLGELTRVTAVDGAITHTFFTLLFIFISIPISSSPVIHGSPPPPLSFPVVSLFHNLTCCKGRLRQWALCWCLWAEPPHCLRKSWADKWVQLRHSVLSERKKEENEDEACSSRGGPLYTSPLCYPWHPAAGFCLKPQLETILFSGS